MRVGLRQSGSSLSQGGHSNEVSTSASWRDRRPAAILWARWVQPNSSSQHP